ncbi:MAG: hypothetical protein CMH49_06820 [Myxococcales bacterium]|nr:hypothetical protein [Myxococcales bacterium]
MDLTPLHPKIVHIPLALAVILPMLNMTLILSWWRQWLPRRVWLISACLHAVMTFGSLVAMQTGESDLDVVEKVVNKSKITEHEEAAELFLWANVMTMLLALVAAIAENEKQGLQFAIICTVLSAVGAFLAIEAGDYGGKLVYKYGAGRAFSPSKYGGIADLPKSVD